MASSRILSISKNIIRPFSPTPSSHRRHNLSLLDCVAHNEYAAMALFYPKTTNNNSTKIISQILQESLSKTLTYYYPFAGIVRDNAYVDCNDMGAEFLDVRVNCRMSDIINSCNNNDTSAEKCAFPQGLTWGSSNSFGGRLAMVQLTHFDCGGMAISANISHKVVDGYSLTNFINDWASIAKDSNRPEKPSPRFDLASFFPPIPNASSTTAEVNNVTPQEQQHHVTRRYLFPASTLNTLKARVTATESGTLQHRPTRVEIVSALLHKCSAAAVSKRRAMTISGNSSFPPSTFMLFANLRPPLPLNIIGNAPAIIATSTQDESDMQLPKLISELRKGKEKLRDRFNTVDPNKLVSESFEMLKQVQQLLCREGSDTYRCSSLCNFPAYGIDFGWGRPQRVSLLSPPLNFFVLMDNQSGDGGVEALVTLEEGDMSVFQGDEELLEFARPI